MVGNGFIKEIKPVVTAEFKKDKLTMSLIDGTENIKFLISELAKNQFNTFKRKFKKNSNE